MSKLSIMFGSRVVLDEQSKSVSHSVMSNSLRPYGMYLTRLFCPWNSLGKNTGVGCHSLLQGIFPTQGSNPGLPHYRQVLYHRSHRGSPRTPAPGELLDSVIEPGSPALLHCRRILYQLNYKGSPSIILSDYNLHG